MEQEDMNPPVEPGSATSGEATSHPQGAEGAGRMQQDNAGTSRRAWPPEPTVLTLQDLLDLPKQILPEPTYTHLNNAFREAGLALTSLFDSMSEAVNSARRRSDTGKVRKHIDVE